MGIAGIRYVRGSFFAARSWRDLADLNAQAQAWCDGIAADRPWPEDRSIAVRDAFERERGSLIALPGDSFPTHDRVEAAIGKTPYARFDLNDYSVPHTHVRRTLVVVATLDEVRILDGAEVIAHHRRSFDKGDCVEIPEHIAELARHKRHARRLRGQDRLFRAAPGSERLLTEAAMRGSNLGAIVAALLRLLNRYGAAELEAAIGEALTPLPPGGFFPAPATPPPAAASGKDPVPAIAPVRLIERFDLDARPDGEFVRGAKPLGRWLPAGSHAEAVVVSGVDASAGIASQGDPRPVLLRLTGPAWTAAEDGAALEVDLAGCTVTGAAYGELSSEKVYARLRTLTCAGTEPGTVIETEVAGFVAGSGKAGVRGPVVSREGALVEKAFLAGMVSGVGQGVAGAFQPQAVATGGGAAVTNTALGDIGRAGLGAGASTAGQKVADYMIRRAEQYQPVIQLRAGTRVSVVFLEGARLDGLTEPKRPNREKSNG